MACVDQGLLGPMTVTWQLHADPAMWVAGITSLHLQALHPRAVAGVVQNSDFRSDPLGRLVRTASFVGVTTYGTTDQAERAARRVRAVHRALRATDEHGRAFPLDEPDLLLWVHCAEVSSFATVVRRAGYRLSPAQVDRYYREQRRAAELVGLRARDVPGSAGELAEYFAGVRPRLRRSADSELVREFLRRPPLPGPLRHALAVYEPLLGRLAYSLLPDWAIALHGRPAYPAERATRLLRGLRAAARFVPAPLRWSVPGGHVTRAIRRGGLAVVPRRALLPQP
ncbi:oxygenase MpaB family protein [Actinosynnema sp.]|uniref:oxygenase MpaB family protein n=1 Tax=Actinosynnema sp. TaxID=1872144 RepID=UPI003F838A52